MRRALAQLIVAALVLAGGPRHPVRVAISPVLGLAPLSVTVRVSIPDPTPEWSCPEIRIEWPDGTVSTGQADCDPADPQFDPFIREQRLLPGVWEVVVRVKQGVKERVVRQTVTVLG